MFILEVWEDIQLLCGCSMQALASCVFLVKHCVIILGFTACAGLAFEDVVAI
jgi:hypothetical protein